MDYESAKYVVRFSSATEAEWNAFPYPIPYGLVAYTLDTKLFKRGNGVFRFDELPNGPSIANVEEAGDAVNMLTEFAVEDENKIIIVNNEIIDAGPNRMAQVLERLDSTKSKDLAQTITMNKIEAKFDLLKDPGATTTPHIGHIVEGRLTKHPELRSLVEFTSPTKIYHRRTEFYSDRNFQKRVWNFRSEGVYYAKVFGMHDTVDTDELEFTLSSNFTGVVITKMSRNEFKIEMPELESTVQTNPDPDPFTITDVTDTELDVYVYGSVTPTGYDSQTTWEVSGTAEAKTSGNATYRTSGTINPGETLTVRMRSSNDFETTLSTTVMIGTITDIWAVTTRAEELLVNASIGVYSDQDLTTSVDHVEGTLIEGEERTYYVNVDVELGQDADSTNVTYSSISSTLGDETQFTHLGDGLYEMKVYDTGDTDSTMTINATVQYITDVGVEDELNPSLTVATVASEELPNDILVGVMGGAEIDQFRAVTTDSNDNVIAVGRTWSDGPGSLLNSLVVKFDSALNVLVRKVAAWDGDSAGDDFFDVTVDPSDNIICAGSTQRQHDSGDLAWIVVKFDKNLNVLVGKMAEGSATLGEFRAVAVDSNYNIICSGHDEMMKFDSSLTLIKHIQFDFDATFGVRWDDIAVDSLDNIIVINSFSSFSGPAVAKLDNSLNPISASVIHYQSTHEVRERMLAVAVDSADNIICVGDGRFEIENDDSWTIRVHKLDSDLNLVANSVLDDSWEATTFFAVAIDSADNIICVGHTEQEGPAVVGNFTTVRDNALLYKFSASLDIISRKVLGTEHYTQFSGVAIDSLDNIVAVGYTHSVDKASDVCLVHKTDKDIPVGTLTGTILSNFTIEDSTTTLYDREFTTVSLTTSPTIRSSGTNDLNLMIENSTLDYILDNTFSS